MEQRLRRTRRSPGLRDNACKVNLLDCGGQSQTHPVRTNVKSLARGTLGSHASLIHGSVDESLSSLTVSLSKCSMMTSSSIDKENTINMGSQRTADSFVFFDTHSHASEEESDDPYLGRRRRTVQPEPRIPQYNIVDDSVDEFMTACTSPETSAAGNKPAALVSPSYPKTLRVPPRQSYVRDEISESTSSITLSGWEQAHIAQAKKEKNYWNGLVGDRTMKYGEAHKLTAEAMHSLGHAHMRMNEYQQAMVAFKTSGKIWKALKGPHHLSVGRALDAYGLAILRSYRTVHSLEQAKRALDEAFAIRFHRLGIWHVDTVETYNKIASVYLYMGDYRAACQAYEEVYLVRQAIFGVNHPSVAISAHALANVHLRMSEPEESFRYFDIALEIYERMDLPIDHPTVGKLLDDRRSLERICMGVIEC